jgi:hypothetical protein
MMRFATIALAFGLCAGAQTAVAQTAQFKGWYVVSSELSTRLAPKGVPLDLDRFLPAEDMEDLLGTWFRFGGEHTYQNGLPNSVNMVIWHVALSRFSKSMAASCKTPELAFHPRFLATLERLCTWPAAQAQSEPVLLDFWLSVMGYNAPEEEFLAWRDFFIRSSYRSRPANETIDAMTLAITMNPYFLLHK